MIINIIIITNPRQRMEMKIDVGSDRVYIMISYGAPIGILIGIVTG